MKTSLQSEFELRVVSDFTCLIRSIVAEIRFSSPKNEFRNPPRQMQTSKIRTACENCRARRKKCDCCEGVFPCSRCVRNGIECVIPPRTTSAAHKNVAFEGKLPPFETTGFHSTMIDFVDKLPPDHAGLPIFLAYCAGICSTHGCQEMLQRVIAIATRIGMDMPRLQVVLKAAGQNMGMNDSLPWSDLPSNFTIQHDAVIQLSNFLGPLLRSWAMFDINTLHYGGFPVFELFYGQNSDGDVAIMPFVNGLMSLLAECSEIGVIKSLLISPQSDSPAMCMSMSFIRPEKVIFAWDVKHVVQTRAAEPIDYVATPVASSSVCSLSENDIHILKTL